MDSASGETDSVHVLAGRLLDEFEEQLGIFGSGGLSEDLGTIWAWSLYNLLVFYPWSWSFGRLDVGRQLGRPLELNRE